MSKRKLLLLVNEGLVGGWDDPRMPTISGFRRRGFTPESIQDFAERVGVARRENVIDVGLLEFCAREHLNKITQRAMVVLNPLKVILRNYPDGQTEPLSIDNNPEEENPTTRKVNFSHELYIEQDDFMENPPKKYFRLAPGGMVRLKNAYIIKCDNVIKNRDGSIKELHCSYILESRSGSDTSGLKVKGVIHWVNAKEAVDAEVRLSDRLFKVENPDSGEGDFKDFINPESLVVVENAKAEPMLADAKPGDKFQFLRTGYFCVDKQSETGKLIFNRTVTLKDSWNK
jgi:glutaminyl-tRNA synthetase